ncbi:MAG: hypothetical protein BLM47_03770 [Candidatus Reconcilbacillus cellulovorans]|uniref:DUF4830 domain-containing protein n=1 Tax=Candidatus Reconcilbacillus cellulovorans TaxID=1906605 RepID=A0A2A6E2X9_9BACL|nr:MAG: hypothetical protein BLM47_03770 [Candidatus Reconcilbacillus cellulovorans]
MEIKSFYGSDLEEVNLMLPERKQMYENMGINLEAYRDKKIRFVHYLLKESCKDKYGTHKMSVTIVEYNSQIIGAYIGHEDGNPGVIKIDKKAEVFNRFGCEIMEERR